MRLLRTITDLERIKERFLNKQYSDSYIRLDYYNNYSFDDTSDCYSKTQKSYKFICHDCSNAYMVKDLKIKDNVIYCKCGSYVHLKDIEPTTPYMSCFPDEKLKHNCENGTVNKFNVPTIIHGNYFYCNKCHKTHGLKYEGYKRENDKLICECGNAVTFEECKLVTTDFTPTVGNVYYDENKISISVIGVQYSFKDSLIEEVLYWSKGSTRLTMNLETGYSYLSNKGSAYSNFKNVWNRTHNGTKAPTMVNATYFDDFSFNQMSLCLDAYYNNLIKKYISFPHLIDFINKKKSSLWKKIEQRKYKEMDIYMNCYHNKRYSYHIKSIAELLQDKNEPYTLGQFVHHNRYLNLNLQQIKDLGFHFYNLKSYHSSLKNKYAISNRETNSYLVDYASSFLNLSKALKKTIAKEEEASSFKKNRNNFYQFVRFASYFKKKENINKLYNTFMNSKRDHYFTIDSVLEKWLKVRTEEYIANLSSPELKERYYYMSDAARLLRRICDVYGADYDIEFKTEKQYHDKLIEIVNTTAFRVAEENKNKEKLSEPFELEDDCLALENNEITIAKNEKTLVDIGREMSICVGGYGHSVRENNCRIAYIESNGVYKVCLELRRTNKKEKVVYTLKQAKLKYNDLVKTNDEYYTIIKQWCKDNDININTSDM